MNALTPIPLNATRTMSSLEIAELTGKQHGHVMRDIKRMLEDLDEGLSKFGDTHRNSQNGQEYPVFNLPKDLTLTLCAGYSTALRKRIIDRWLELEEEVRQPAPPVLSNEQKLAEAYLLATSVMQTQVARIDQLEGIIETIKPKALVAETIGNALVLALEVTREIKEQNAMLLQAVDVLKPLARVSTAATRTPRYRDMLLRAPES